MKCAFCSRRKEDPYRVTVNGEPYCSAACWGLAESTIRVALETLRHRGVTPEDYAEFLRQEEKEAAMTFCGTKPLFLEKTS